MKDHLRQENLKHVLKTLQKSTKGGKTVVKIGLSPAYIRKLDDQISYDVKSLRDTSDDDY